MWYKRWSWNLLERSQRMWSTRWFQASLRTNGRRWKWCCRQSWIHWHVQKAYWRTCSRPMWRCRKINSKTLRQKRKRPDLLERSQKMWSTKAMEKQVPQDCWSRQGNRWKGIPRSLQRWSFQLITYINNPSKSPKGLIYKLLLNFTNQINQLFYIYLFYPIK